MSFVRIRIPGAPHPQARPRHRVVTTKAGKTFSHTYNKKGKDTEYRARVAHEADMAMSGKAPFTGPLKLTAGLWLPKPKSKPKYKVYPDVKPDLDNMLKALKDGMEKIVYNNDSQVCSVRAEKKYAINEAPYTKVVIEQLDE